MSKLAQRKQGLTERFDLRLLHSDGRELLTSMLVSPLTSSAGAFDGVLAQFTDLSSQERHLEQQGRLAAIVEWSEDAIFSRDLDGTIRTWNRAAERLFQYPADEAIGMSTARLCPPGREEQLDQRKSEINSGSAIDPLVAFLARKDGSKVEVSVRGSLLRDGAGQPTGASIIVRDLTELRRTEDHLRQAQKMESVGRLAGGIAHDFNNLLTVIISYTAFALEEIQPGEPLREELVQVDLAGKKAAVLTKQLLAFSRQQVLQPQVLDLNHSVRELERMLARVLGEDIHFVLHLDPQAGRVMADPGQVEQVLMNLVVNARDAMPRGGSLTLETSAVELDAAYAADHLGVTPGPHVVLAVTDSGTGIDPAIMGRIFEPFFTTKEKGLGTGLGLATVFGIVKQSGGHLWAHSEPGVGTTFKVYFSRTDQPVSPTLPTPDIHDLRGSETVLLVEDDLAVCFIMKTMLEKQGYQVLDAPNGREAMALSAGFPGRIDLLVTDVIMPVMNGRQVADQLAVIRPAMKVLYVSGHTEDTIVHHGILDPGITYLSKPVTPDTLARKVREVLGPSNGARAAALI